MPVILASNKEEAAALGRYLLEDAAHYATSRKASDDQALLIVDEFGVLRSTNATDLYERTREAGLSIYAAAQSYHAFGRERDHVLAAAAMKILHRSGNPQPVIAYAGQRERFTFSRGIGMSGGDDEEVLLPMSNRPAGEPGIHTVARPNKEYTVPPEDVQQLQVGQIVAISGGKCAYVQVHLPVIPPQLFHAASQLVRSAPNFQSLPTPLTVPSPQVSSQTRRQRKSTAPQTVPNSSNLGQQGASQKNDFFH